MMTDFKKLYEAEVVKNAEKDKEISGVYAEAYNDGFKDGKEEVQLMIESKCIETLDDVPIHSLVKCIVTQKEKEVDKYIWKDSIFKDIADLESNNVGVVGEMFLEELCNKSSIDSSIDGTKTKQLGGGIGDGEIKKKTNEIKTARLGNGGSKSFQHELGEFPWKAEFMTFIDISPNFIYLTIFPNWDEIFYKKSGKDKSIKCLPYFPTKTITQRKSAFNFKLDTSLSINESNVEKGKTLKITHDTTYNNVNEYINRIIQ